MIIDSVFRRQTSIQFYPVLRLRCSDGGGERGFDVKYLVAKWGRGGAGCNFINANFCKFVTLNNMIGP